MDGSEHERAWHVRLDMSEHEYEQLGMGGSESELIQLRVAKFE